MTIAEGRYFNGAFALINSVIKCGFCGNIYVFYAGNRPSWLDFSQFARICPSVKVLLFHHSSDMHLRFSKAKLMLQVLEEDPDLDGIFYADPDIIFLAEWDFFKSWISQGVALCVDNNFPWIHNRHPWRIYWNTLSSRAGLRVIDKHQQYGNSGFVGVSRSEIILLRNWVKIIAEYQASGNDVTSFKKESRVSAVNGDQDLLAAAVNTVENEPVYIGMEGMGFNGHFLFLSHAIDRVKPWDKFFIWSALKGNKPSRPDFYWLINAQEPFQVLPKYKWLFKFIDYRIGQIISRLWVK